MRYFRHTIWIARPPEAVFERFIDFGRTPHWRQYVRTMERLDQGEIKPGSRIRVTMDLMGRVATYDLIVVACQPPSLWRHRTNETDFDGFVEYRFDAEGDGTRVTMSGQARPISLDGWLAMPLLLMSRGRAYRDQLPQLKRAMEGEGS